MIDQPRKLLEKPEENPKMLTFFFFMIVAAAIAFGIGTQFINASATLYVESLGGTAVYAGFIHTITAGTATVARILSGRAFDQKGRRSVIIGGFIIYAASTAAYSLLPDALPVMAALRGVGLALTNTGLAIAIADVIPKQRMSEGLGYYGLVSPLTNAIGPLMITGLLAASQFCTIYFASAGIFVLGSIMMYFCSYEKNHDFSACRHMAPRGSEAEKNTQTEKHASGKTAAFIEKSALPCAVLQLFTALVQGALSTFLMAHAFQAGIANPGLYYTLSAVSMVVFRLTCAKFVYRFRPVPALVLGFLLHIAGLLCLLFMHQYHLLYYAAGIFVGVSVGITGPVMQAVVIKMSPGSRRGAAMGTYLFTLDIGIAVGSSLWGVLIDSSGYSAMYIGCIACFVIAIVLAHVLLWKVEPAHTTSSKE